MRFLRSLAALAGFALLASCGPPPPPVNASREVLWQQLAHQPIDKVLMTWGVPWRETQLSDGARMVAYQHTTIYDDGSPYERRSACTVTFLAEKPDFRIENISMEGSEHECQVLAQGNTGYTRYVYTPMPAPYYPNPYRPY